MGMIGIWIDHRKAVLARIDASGEHVETLLSNVEKHPERAGDSQLKGSYEARQVSADDRRQRALTGHLNGFYDAVIAKTAACPTILIFGPGEAKVELKHRFEHAKLSSHIACIETTDKLTDRQIAAKVRDYLKSPIS